VGDAVGGVLPDDLAGGVDGKRAGAPVGQRIVEGGVPRLASPASIVLNMPLLRRKPWLPLALA
jgi:hypothetical protein